jgi:hypothetical protein
MSHGSNQINVSVPLLASNQIDVSFPFLASNQMMLPGA